MQEKNISTYQQLVDRLEKEKEEYGYTYLHEQVLSRDTLSKLLAEGIRESDIRALFNMTEYTFRQKKKELGVDRDTIVTDAIESACDRYGEEVRPVMMSLYYYGKFKRISNSEKGSDELYVNGIVKLNMDNVQEYMIEQIMTYGEDIAKLLECVGDVKIGRYMRQQKRDDKNRPIPRLEKVSKKEVEEGKHKYIRKILPKWFEEPKSKVIVTIYKDGEYVPVEPTEKSYIHKLALYYAQYCEEEMRKLWKSVTDEEIKDLLLVDRLSNSAITLLFQISMSALDKRLSKSEYNRRTLGLWK